MKCRGLPVIYVKTDGRVTLACGVFVGCVTTIQSCTRDSSDSDEVGTREEKREKKQEELSCEHMQFGTCHGLELRKGNPAVGKILIKKKSHGTEIDLLAKLPR